jgi:uncharacterized protein
MLPINRPGAGPVDTSHSPCARLQTLNLADVRLLPGFWTPKQAVNRQVSLRHGHAMLAQNGNLHNLRLAAGLVDGPYRGRNFLDSDVYKWLEAVAWDLGRAPDAELQALAGETIGLVEAAQRDDGYINSYYQTVGPDAAWTDMDHGHELYCAGHLFQAALAFHRAAGDDRLLEVARRFADHICSVFGEDKRHAACGHPEVEMALIELYRDTGAQRYLALAHFFIDQRGQRKMSGYGAYGPEYHQDHVPVREVTEAAGHAVRQLYLASGVTDLYLETGEAALLAAMQRLSHDITATKLYITGGVGARFDGEAFGDPYELPPDRCYCETCAAIASFMWNWRMLLATGDSVFADQMERALYNNILAGPALDGAHFFYVNPLMVRGGSALSLSSNPPPGEGFVPAGRPAWHDVACCPPNVMRTLASLANYLATRSADGVQVHHYAPAEIACSLADGRRIAFRMVSDYPWQGQVRIEIAEASGSVWELALRVPEWSPKVAVTVNGQEIAAPQIRKGYLVLERPWQPGDVVELALPMEPVFVASHPRVDATRGCVAIQRGPIVYCLEDRDQEVEGRLLDVAVDVSQGLTVRRRDDLLGGVMVVEAQGQYIPAEPWAGALYRPVGGSGGSEAQPARLVAVPYYAWGNRGIRGMRVWLPISSSK